MMNVLQIAIPTYNRPNELKQRILELSLLFDHCINGQVKIDIFDNSDSNIRAINIINTPDYIEYHSNDGNLGFIENVKKCLSLKTCRFIWVVSDDDSLLVNEIIEFIKFLDCLDEKIMGVSITYEVSNAYKNTYDGVTCLSGSHKDQKSFFDCIDAKRLPFDFLSGFVINTRILSKIDMAKLKTNNLYPQSIFYCTALKPDDLIAFYGKPLIRWQGEDETPWPLLQQLYSRNEIAELLLARHSVSLNSAVMMRELLKWAILGNIGYNNVKNIENEKFEIFYSTLRQFNIINIIMGIILILPKRLCKYISITAFALMSKENKNNGFINGYKKNKSLLNNKISRREG